MEEIQSVIINYTRWGVCGLFTQVYIVKMVKVNRVYASMKVWVYSEFTKEDEGGGVICSWTGQWNGGILFLILCTIKRQSFLLLSQPVQRLILVSQQLQRMKWIYLNWVVSLLWRDYVWCFWGCWKRFFASELETKRIVSYVDEPCASQTAHWKTVCSEPTSFFELAGNP